MGGKRRKRTLRPDERSLWGKVAASTDPLTTRSSSPSAPDPDETLEPDDAQAPGLNDAPVSPRPIGTPAKPAARPKRATAPTPPPYTVDYTRHEPTPVGRPQAGLDRRTAERLRKGARDPDARIDLHGMTAARAHRAVLAFVADSLARGHRMVLVITGKGSGGEHWTGLGRGIIRNALPGWLDASPVSREIVGVYQAHQRHGGAGAVYIYLKRRR